MSLLRAPGYNVVDMWECAWDHRVKTDEDVKAFLEGFDMVAPLNPRDAFFEDRTVAVSLLVEAEEGEQIQYVDVTSLYLWVKKTACYPVGHPKIITHPPSRTFHLTLGWRP